MMEHVAGTATLNRPDDTDPDIYHASYDQKAFGHAGLSRPKERGQLIRRLCSEGSVVFATSCALYVAVAILLDFHYQTFNGDAVARMANAFYVLYSRDPHLAAIGFVWNPGTSIADIVPLLFYHLWTPLATHMFAGSLVSAFAMAGAVYQVRCTLAEWGVAHVTRLILLAILVLNGMFLYYGGNGMSEALYLFTLLATCRYLLRWIRCGDLHSLVYAALALGLCYLVRYEAVLPAMLAGVLVLGVASARSSAVGIRRIWGAMDDLVIFEIPFALTFIGWAGVSYVITGSPFEQFSSIYGASSQLKVAGSVALKDRILQDVHDVLYLAPLLPLIAIIALYLARRRRDVGVFAPITVVGGGLAFDLLAYIDNSIQPWFRYFITAVPLEVILVGSLFATAPAFLRVGTAAPITRRARGWLWTGLGVLTSLVFLVPASVTTPMGMANPKIGYEETGHIGFIFFKHPTPPEEAGRATFPGVVNMANWFARQHLANGQVVVDNFSHCVPNLFVISPNPRIFVIPNDRDFQRTLADPLTFHAHYILDVDPTGDGGLTAPNTSYPGLWSTGGGFAKNVHTFRAWGECPEFRLFKVIGHPNPNV